jgi:lipid-binding SYLF domain-containing protein
MGQCTEAAGLYDGVAMDGSRLMTTREVAERLGIGARRVRV